MTRIIFLNALAVILFLRCSFIIIYRHFNKSDNEKKFLNKYCSINKNNPWVYRIWGLSALWLIIEYQDLIQGLIKEILK